MPTGNGESSSNSSPSSKKSLNKPERPPVLKRSKTIAEETRTGHFPGPLFPAVRRASTSPPSSNRTSESSTSTTNSFSSRSFSSSFSDYNFNFADRDYVYPSFLGPYATRSRVTVKSKPKLQKNEESLSQSLPTNASKLSNLSVDVGSLEEPARRFGTPPPLPPPSKMELKAKPRLKSDKELNPLSIQISASSALSTHVPNSSASFSPRRTTGLRSSWSPNLVSLFSI